MMASHVYARRVQPNYSVRHPHDVTAVSSLTMLFSAAIVLAKDGIAARWLYKIDTDRWRRRYQDYLHKYKVRMFKFSMSDRNHAVKRRFEQAIELGSRLDVSVE